MIRNFFLAVGDVSRPDVLAILAKALAVTLLLFVILGALIAWLLTGADPCSALGMGSCALDAGGGGIGAVTLTLLAVWLLFPGVAVGVISGFADRIAGAVERAHYPTAAASAQPIGIARGAAMGLRSAARVMLFNLLALPFYIVLLVTGIGPLVLFVVVNGLAFGRDLSELAAARHGDAVSRRAWLRSTRGEQARMGTLVSAMFLIPFVNLVAPVIGAAMAVHAFNRSPPRP